MFAITLEFLADGIPCFPQRFQRLQFNGNVTEINETMTSRTQKNIAGQMVYHFTITILGTKNLFKSNINQKIDGGHDVLNCNRELNN